MILEVYDLECLSNLFTYTGFDCKEKKYYQFVICKWRNDLEELYKHLFRDKLIQVGFNNESYDYPLLHHLINHYEEYKCCDGQEVAGRLYNKSQAIIESEFSSIADKNKYIKQLDLYRIWHYNNKARSCSLKDLEIAMRMDNIEEMPIHHSTWCKEGDENCILSYNRNDVEATYKFLLVTLGKTDFPLYKGKNKIELRQNIEKQFHVPVLNLGDVPMGYNLILHLYSRAVNQSIYDLKKLKTLRSIIRLEDCIPSWAKIETPEFNKFLDSIKSTSITGSRKEFNYSIRFHDYTFDFGLGGSHGCCEPGIYESNDEWVIADYDVGSLYPSIAKSLNLYPEHLGPEFMELYKGFIEDRLKEKHKPKKDRNNTLIEGYKLILNGTYGKSNEESSFLYDPLYTFKTTIAGQLFIAMWAERWVKAVPELKFLQTNTDGQTILVPRNKLKLIEEVNNQLTKETSLTIEEVFYSKMILKDVNNYIGVYEDSTKENEHIKLKGCFEIDKEFHKDPSMRIVPLSVKNYFIYNIPIRETILNHTDIYDFCLRLKTNSKSQAIYRCVKDKKVVDIPLDRTTRYYISKTGGTLFKDFGNDKVSGVNVGYCATIFNKYEKKDIKDYNLNYNFYISEAMKLKNAVDDGQLSLF
jgi:hypothetical protein